MKHYPTWNLSQRLIKHPKTGEMLTGNEILELGHKKNCPHCGVKMYRAYHMPDEVRDKYSYLHCTVDHKLPKSIYPALTFEYNNLEVICRKCNVAKNNDTYFYERQKVEAFVVESTEALNYIKELMEA